MITAIDADLLEAINESSRSCFPDEFLCMLTATEGVIDEMLLLPGTVYGDSHSFLNEWMAPIGLNPIGTVHSHPGYSNEPSEADLQYFSNMGGVHIITCLPYDEGSWKAYDSAGRALRLEIRR
ncbi:MAG: Mov34/MPN/PAD-1 family protein [Candidatus Methanomethylophilaceae archaeon]|jgi:proteasome lid subunit RPN8/RPN11|nr:hypothetical protein AOA81_02010 [Methanomassiliicoccales archaeon RumEn M2]MDD2532490.1 Mov34/MPN/PAD-1 family protein [Candidatus Methanomethylophilaceae archaeon]MDI9378881.1 Mov34/MPN/PAD-1 family protein [Candidatus Thermoplasmatota archaeon]MDD2778725.1 Mov34/MPN/PAD-1 family protein [Candidatus Methanomethylophilaceae archaeon]MDD3127690.1 Mov34/MPN/PAD-1 family protein [Candidatus Methanomethylophilaceae archaeon]